MARRKRYKELYAVNLSGTAKMFDAWNAIGKFKDLSLTGAEFFSVVGYETSLSQMEVLFMWIFAYRRCNDKIVYPWALKVAHCRQNT